MCCLFLSSNSLDLSPELGIAARQVMPHAVTPATIPATDGHPRKGTLVAPLSLRRGSTLHWCSGGVLASPSLLAVLVLEEVASVALPEHHWLQCGTDLGVAPVLTKHIGWITVTRDVVERDHARCDGLSCVVVGEAVVSLSKL